ncbi:hypothetical protein CYMTET_30951 [Cymbomonas tetramitiformis]|uniref:Uncharacterized protein n=1 Tax=Cymbomonas tetramitiformis TaxID=36881 RepID=A0AAE0FHT1_9CHLO|nr:hypothetical protein CYMTET_30951 [Cymbomonas tetramitiformis]
MCLPRPCCQAAYDGCARASGAVLSPTWRVGGTATQVLSQLTSIFGEELIPSSFMTFMNFFRMALVLDMQTLLNTKCLSYYRGITLSGQGFIVTFYQNVAMPWVILCLFFMTVTLLHARFRRKAQELKQKPKAERPDLERATFTLQLYDLIAAAGGVGLFLVTYIHPNVSTTMFQLFNCMELQYDDPELQAGRFLRMDPKRRCLTEDWWNAAIIDFLTLLMFVIGFPVMLYVVMHDRRKYTQVQASSQAHAAAVQIPKNFFGF